MKKFTITSINNIKTEEAHKGAGSRQLLVKTEYLHTPYLEAVTKGYLEIGKVFDWHIHQDIDEVFIVLKGNGKFYWEDEIVDYKEGDIVTIPANSKHKIEAQGKETNEYYFIRIKS